MDVELPSGGDTGRWRQRMAAVSRWLHIYLSLVSFGMVAFFAITGLTLNHADFFTSKRSRTVQSKGVVPKEWVQPRGTNQPDREAVIRYLRLQHRLQGALADFRVEENQCSVSFRGPGYTADIFINRDGGYYELTEIRMGLVALLNDLHKGRDSGAAWSWVIDASAILMMAVSLSGLVLIWFLKRRRVSGLAAVVLGSLACWLIYLWWVP